MTLFANNKIECFIIHDNSSFPLRSVTLSSLTINSVSVPTQTINQSPWVATLQHFPKRRLQVRLQLLHHDDIADNLLLDAAVAGSPITILFKLNTHLAMQSAMHIEQFDCQYEQDILDVIRVRAVNIDDVTIIDD